MSIHVTVSGNPVNIRRGRMVLSDLDQIKKNERDRRRRLRLEQVRQQSKEISNRLLERAKKIAREELNKLEKDAKSELRQMHDKKIMEIQEKCQEDLEDIGQAHACAALQPDIDAIREEEGRRDRAMAIKRGKDAAQHMREIKQKDSTEVTHQERLRKVREEENIRAATIAKLPKPTTILEDNSNSKINSSTEDSNEEVICERLTPNKKSNKVLPKKSPKKTKKSSSKEYQKTLSPKPGPSGLQKQFRRMASKKKTIDTDRIEHIIDNAIDEHQPRRTVPVISTTPAKADKITRYNPEDYTQDTSDTSSISSSGSSSVSDDSSYFSDGAEQVSYRKDAKTAVLTGSKVRLYDHDTRQRNVYNTPLGIVERIDIGNEPSAIEAAQAMKDVEDAKAHTVMCRKLTAQRRGQDAILREKVRRDYQALIKNLEHLTQEERKLKASQIHSNAEEDTHARLHQRTKCQEEHRKKMNRAARNVLSTDNTLSRYSHLAEKTTSPAQRKDEICSDVPNSTWQEPYLDKEEITVCHTQDQDSEVSREEQILDMLKKVERQKRLLLKEFGASLPDNIFNASVKPLFGDRTPAPATAQVADTAKLSSPEITVINMSNYNECAKKDRKVKKKPESLSTKKIEIAIQTSLDRISPAEDKSIQVELPQENVDIPHSSTYKDVGTGQASHPIEPQVTVITPETDDSSNDSTSSDITGMIIEIDKKEVTVTPKKRKSNLKVSKRPSPRVYQKIRSTSVSSKATSPMKRFSRSHSSSRLTSPQKRTKCTDAPDTASRRVDIHVSKSEFNDETDPSQETRVSIDASAESSQTFSGVNDQDGSTGKPYRIRTQVKKWIRIKDTSDTTSTSFASPPPVKPRSMLDALTNITPILEMLDSSRTEELRRLRQDISPVSTPETPSPRTMRMPSNIPHRDKISRMLRYNSNNSQNNNSVTLSSTQNDQTLSTDPSDPQEAATSKCESASLQQPSVSSKVCICKNPKCKLLHIKLDDIHDYALKNCPEILQKYEDLQNLCAERIASLTDLIERVRSEQKDMDFSLISPSDETSLMQLPTSKPVRSDVQAIRKLIESIEAIHSQLAKTLFESQKIIENGATSDNEISRDAEVQVTTSTPRSKSIDTITAPIQKSEVAKAKPKVISDEKVNIQLNRFKIQQKPQAVPAIKTPERNSWPPCAVSLHEEEVIEKLSKEILEQSKSLDKASTAFVSLKENDEISMQRKGSLSNDASLKNNLLEHKKDNSIINLVQEVTKENDFTPILVAIPKVARAHGTVTSISARPKPPVTLLNAPHWQELESSGHELSTIVEFDTTDTVNKSIKSPTKSKNMAVDTVEDLQNILLKGTIDAESKSAITVKPSVHVAPLSVQQDQNIPVQIADSTTDMKHFVDLISAQRSQEATTIYDSPGKSKNATDCIASMKTEAERDWVDCTLENSNKQLQCNTITEDPILQAKDILALGSSISTDFNNQHKNSQHRTTSTSLNSFSGLSGISEITSSPSSELLKYASSPEEMETALKKLGLSWAVTTLKKTREASALSSSSNSDVTPINTARRMISPTKKHLDPSGLPDISDVSSISIKEANKSTEQAVLMKGRTSTPKFQNSNSNSERSSTTNTSGSLQEPSDSLTVPNVSLTKIKSDNKQLQNL
ncbi:uncharacterized protein LOC105190389 [Harpegnathos saltator]|uniref:uncharacterized protein LOC105190389 n=1 Tax=Harpegnathos saltator TaxID=610380 RepID=UPI000DBEE2DE|nr:uncharacterized protein LOC105190389 [Harpegnathos saltator]